MTEPRLVSISRTSKALLEELGMSSKRRLGTNIESYINQWPVDEREHIRFIWERMCAPVPDQITGRYEVILAPDVAEALDEMFPGQDIDDVIRKLYHIHAGSL